MQIEGVLWATTACPLAYCMHNDEFNGALVCSCLPAMEKGLCEVDVFFLIVYLCVWTNFWVLLFVQGV